MKRPHTKPKPAPAPKPTASAGAVPHSWLLEAWPPNVAGNSKTGAYWSRAYRDELLLEGALTRVGRQLIFFGRGFERWLLKKQPNVVDYTVAPSHGTDDRAAPSAAATSTRRKK